MKPEIPAKPGKCAWWFGTAVGALPMPQTLTVEPRFKSSGEVSDLMTIGDVARRAGVATSTIRYYERRGLLSADTRLSGQRRYRTTTLRRLVFIGMMQDIGLSLEEIHDILRAESAQQWKAVAARRLKIVDARIAELQQARELLAGVLHCPYDNPATDGATMGNEIDRRLAEQGSDVASSEPYRATPPAGMRQDAEPMVSAFGLEVEEGGGTASKYGQVTKLPGLDVLPPSRAHFL
jgi:DNA-binding transcriptional MerR regulator